MGHSRVVMGAALVTLSLAAGCAADTGGTASTPSASASTSVPPPSVTATPTPTPTPSPSPTALASVILVCGNLDDDIDYLPQEDPVDLDGTPNFTSLWEQQFGCDTGMGDGTVTEAVAVETPLQQAVVALGRKIGYGEYGDESDSDAQILYSVFQGCGSNEPDDYYATSKDLSDGQVDEIRLWMTLCPDHPQAKIWRAAISASAEARKAEKSGNRVYDGTYLVPSEMKRGTFVVEDVENCYWETRNSSGDIVANNFVLAAPRVVAKVDRSAVVFTAEGCGQWNRQ